MFEKDPRLFSPEYKNLSPEQKAMVKLEITLTNFFRDFNSSITRWERVVYPLLIVLSLMVFSGYYLIYNVTRDMHTMSNHIDPQMQSNLKQMNESMVSLSGNIAAVTENMNVIATKMQGIDNNIGTMNKNIHSLASSVDHMRYNMEIMTYMVSDMNNTMKSMTDNTGLMSRDLHKLQRPMNFMDKFVP